MAKVFQSTPSVWRETSVFTDSVKIRIFQSTPSVWRETTVYARDGQWQHISIHSLRVEGDLVV